MPRRLQSRRRRKQRLASLSRKRSAGGGGVVVLAERAHEVLRTAERSSNEVLCLHPRGAGPHEQCAGGAAADDGRGLVRVGTAANHSMIIIRNQRSRIHL